MLLISNVEKLLMT